MDKKKKKNNNNKNNNKKNTDNKKNNNSNNNKKYNSKNNKKRLHCTCCEYARGLGISGLAVQTSPFTRLNNFTGFGPTC